MTNAFSATPSADQPPIFTGVRPAAPDSADRWDWLRIGIIFSGAVFLLSLIPAVLLGWYYEMLVTQQYHYSQQVQISLLFTIGDLLLPATLLIAMSTLPDRTFWGAGRQAHLGAAGRVVLAVGLIAAMVGLAVAFNNRIYQALLPSPSPVYNLGAQLRSLGFMFLLTGTEHGLVLGVALAFVFRRLSQRTGRARRVQLLRAALLAGGILGLSTHLETLFVWATQAWMLYVQEARHTFNCAGGSGTGCFPPEAVTWLVASVLPIVVALLLGAQIGSPLAYPHGARDAHAREHTSEAMGGVPGASAHLQQAQGGRSIWRALGIGVGSFVAGLLATGAWLYAVSQSLSVNRQSIYTALIAMQLAPFGILALICAIRLIRMPRDQRPAAWGVGLLALVSVLGLLPTLVPQVFLIPQRPSIRPGMLPFAGVSFAFTVSLGALLALCWWPASASSMRRVLTVALAGWLGFALPILLVAGYTAYQVATYNYSQTACHGPGCGAIANLITLTVIEIGLIAVFVALPLTLLGVWMGSWLLEQRGRSRAGDAAA